MAEQARRGERGRGEAIEHEPRPRLLLPRHRVLELPGRNRARGEERHREQKQQPRQRHADRRPGAPPPPPPKRPPPGPPVHPAPHPRRGQSPPGQPETRSQPAREDRRPEKDQQAVVHGGAASHAGMAAGRYFWAGATGAGAGAAAGARGAGAPEPAGAGRAPPGAGGAGAGFAADFVTTLLVTELRTPTKDSPSDVRKNRPAHTAVSLLRNVTAPRPPKAEVAAPPPSAAPMPASFPGWRRMTKIMKTHSRTWMAVKKTSMEGRAT